MGKDELSNFSFSDDAAYRFSIIRGLAMKHRTTEVEIDAAAVKLAVSRRQVYRLIEAVRASPYVDTLESFQGTAAAFKSRLPLRVEAIITACIEELFTGAGEKIIVKDVEALVSERCLAECLEPPSYRTIGRRVKKYLELLGDKSNGRKRRKKQVGGRLLVKYPLSWVQADHTMMDVIADLTQYGLGLRRPWLTLIVDVATRLVYGYYIGLCRPTARSLMFAVLQGALPKRQWLEQRGLSWSKFQEEGVEDIWPIAGLFRLLSCDNDKTFKNKMVARAATYLGFEAHFRPGNTPNI